MGPLRLSDALEFRRSEVLRFKHAAKQLAGGFADHDLSGLGEGLQARGEVGGVSYHRLFLRGSCTNEVTDHHEARGDAHARRQGLLHG